MCAHVKVNMRTVVSQQHQLTGSKSSLFDKIIKNKQNKEIVKCDTVDHASSSLLTFICLFLTYCSNFERCSTDQWLWTQLQLF